MTFIGILTAIWWDFKSVLTEELIYRGALLVLVIHYLGNKRGILISAAAFGIYHWFSFGILGNWLPMILVFIGTGIMGYAWALAFDKTNSIFLPLGLHLGWNVVFNTLFSKGPLGDILLLITGGVPLDDWLSLLNFIQSMIIAPLVILWWVKNKISREECSY